MGHELKRVALDFSWPMDKVWEGYLNPYAGLSVKCQTCDGKGTRPEMQRLTDLWYGYTDFKPEDRGSVPLLWDSPGVYAFASRNVNNFPNFYLDSRNIERQYWLECFESALSGWRLTKEEAIKCEGQRLADLWNRQWAHHLNADDVAALVEGGRLYDFTHDFVPGEGWKPKENFVMPTPQQVNDWSLTGFGHDGINQWVVCKAEAKRLGIETHCPDCDGEGSNWPSPELETLHANWTPSEPPEGEGYQMWENVSEGSPISPVFQFRGALAHWLSKYRSLDGNYRQWMNMIEDGYAPSIVVAGGTVMTGVQATDITRIS
jgi:hypothetical protein